MTGKAPDLASFIRAMEERTGSAEQAIKFALLIDSHYDMRQFLADWQTGEVATNAEYADYWEWLTFQRQAE